MLVFVVKGLWIYIYILHLQNFLGMLIIQYVHYPITSGFQNKREFWCFSLQWNQCSPAQGQPWYGENKWDWRRLALEISGQTWHSTALQALTLNIGPPSKLQLESSQSEWLCSLTSWNENFELTVSQAQTGFGIQSFWLLWRKFFPSQVYQTGSQKANVVFPLGKLLRLETFFSGHEFIAAPLG